MVTYPAGADDVTTTAEAARAVEQLQSSAELAVDLEQDAMHAFRARLCFIQVATDTDLFLFDTLSSEVRAGVLADLFGDKTRTKFFHAAAGDLQYLAQAGVRVRGLFDTHRAATLLGWPKVGLADLAHDLLGIELPKEHQQSDFSLRPLPPAMRQYIADDVRYLCEIGRRVRESVRNADILEEVELDCQRLSDEATSPPEVGADYQPKLPRNLPGTQQALADAIARALHQKRLAWAESLDIPHGRMLSNAAIAEMAKKPPRTLKELARTPRVRGRFAREHGPEVLEVIERLRAASGRGELPLEVPASNLPSRARRKREDALRTFRSEKSGERKVTPSAVLSNALVVDLAKSPPSTMDELARVPYFGNKRVRLYGADLLQLLSKYR